MTQQSGATPASDNPEQPQQAQITEQTNTPLKPTKSEKRAKNLYEPYDPPSWFWIALRTIARFIYFLKLNLRVIGRENIPKEGAFIIASNHLSWMDVPLVPSFINRKVVYMAKEELFYGKVGWIVRFLGAFPVKRGEADRQSLRAADTQLKAGKIFMIFPEGTRSKTHQLGKGHVGLGMIALRAGVPVVPVAVWGSEYTFKKLRPRVTISYGKPLLLAPKGKKITREDIEEATNEVMRAIAVLMPPEYRGIYGDLEPGDKS
ncbi:MAG TPA: lysophospholipid acyltransferase family protein [Ktedonobacteraceae bacterium]